MRCADDSAEPGFYGQTRGCLPEECDRLRPAGADACCRKARLRLVADSFVDHDRQRPEQQNEAGLLLIIADQHIDRPLSGLLGVIRLCHGGLLGQNGIGFRTDDPQVDRVHNDDDQYQR